MGKVIHWEKLKFDHTNKWYMQNQEFVQENETQKHLYDFEILKDHLILARRPDLLKSTTTKKENLPNCGLCYLGWLQSKIERKQKKKKKKVSRPCLGIEKTVEHKSGSDTSCNWYSWYSQQWLIQGLEDFR